MRLGLWLPRLSHLRVLGPVAAAARRRGWSIYAFCPKGGPKNDAAGSPFSFAPAVIVDGATDAIEGIRYLAPDAILSASVKVPDWVHGVMAATKPRVVWGAVGYLQEEIVWTLMEGPGILRHWTFVTTGSPEGREQLAAHFPLMCVGDEIRRKLVVTGYPPLDTFSILDRATIREKYRIAPDERIVLFIPAARPHGLAWWRRATFDGPLAWAAPYLGLPSYRRIIAAVNRYAHRHGARIICKTREKNQDPPWLDLCFSQTVGDQSWYPHTTLELLKAADMYIGLASATAVEAAAAGLPSLHIFPWPDVANVPGYVPFRKRYFHDSRLWAPAFRDSSDLRFIESAMDWIDCYRKETPDILPMCGPIDGRASERVLDAVEKYR